MPFSATFPRSRERRHHTTARECACRRTAVVLPIVLLLPALFTAVTLPAQGASGAADLFALSTAPIDGALPDGWHVRAVRGQRAPMSRIVDTSGTRYMRISGQGDAGWFYRELPAPIAVSMGQLHWTWRTPLAPQGADVGRTGTDDAALRVFVVFGAHGRFDRRPRTLFYTLGDGVPSPDRANSPFGVRIAGRPARTRDWTHTTARPFEDYQRIWGGVPRPIVAVGVMQDTEQTGSAARGDIMGLFWSITNDTKP